jgi:hypothetical protein
MLPGLCKWAYWRDRTPSREEKGGQATRKNVLWVHAAIKKSKERVTKNFFRVKA